MSQSHGNGPTMDGLLSRRRRFAQVPDELVVDSRVTQIAFRLWCRLDRYAGQDGAAFPRSATLAADLQVSVPTIERAYRNLRETGWIRRSRRRGMSNVWDTELLDAPCPVPVGSPPDRPLGGDRASTSDVSGPIIRDGARSITDDGPSEGEPIEGYGGGSSPVRHQARASRSAPRMIDSGDDRGGRRPPTAQRPGPVLDAGGLPVIQPPVCDRHLAGNPGHVPCRECREARTLHETSRAARGAAIERRGHQDLARAMRDAETAAWRPPAGTLRTLIATTRTQAA